MNDVRPRVRVVVCAMGRLAVTVAGCAWLAACASTGSSAYRLSQVDVRPELQGCGSYTAPAREHGYNVELQFVVDESGEVEPETVDPRPRRDGVGDRHPPELLRRASSDISSCSFTPAVLDGEPVPVRVTKRLFYPDQG